MIVKEGNKYFDKNEISEEMLDKRIAQLKIRIKKLKQRLAIFEDAKSQ